MSTTFSEQLWIDFDLEIEFFLRHLVGWIVYNAQKDKIEQRNFHEGLYWSYNSYPEFAKHLPGFSARTLRTIISRCVKNGLLVIGNFNKKHYDNTNWYTLTAKGWTYFEREARKLYPDSFADNGEPGSDLYTPDRSVRPPDRSVRPIPKDLNSIRKKIIINNNPKKKDDGDSCTESEIEENNQALQENVENKEVNKAFGKARSDYQKNQFEKRTVSRKNDQFGIDNIVNDNPFQIPAQMLHDWILLRNKKRAAITQTAWTRLLRELHKCQVNGVNAVEAFETMVAHGWQSLKYEYFKDKNKTQHEWDIESVMKA